MTVELKKINTYYLNPKEFSDRRERMESFLSSIGMNFERCDSVVNLQPRQNNYSVGSISMIEKAMKKNEYPFLLLDDDVDLIVELPEKIEVPKECDVVYLGASTYECHGPKPIMKLKEYNEFFYRVYYTLSSHALLINSEKSANRVIEILRKSIEHDQYSDIYMALDSEDHIFLTPKDGPYFYQIPDHTREVTKFLWKDLASSYL